METFTGLLAYSEDREDEKLVNTARTLHSPMMNVMIMQVEHCEDVMASESSFKNVADKAAGPLDTTRLHTFHSIIQSTIKRRHKLRISMNQVCMVASNA